jgi:hypothetical protein
MIFDWILELFRLCGTFVFLLDFGTVPTVWYICFSVRFWNCSDSVVCLFYVFSLNTHKSILMEKDQYLLPDKLLKHINPYQNAC